MLPPPGTLVAGKYRLEQLLGEGGMGAVYRARHVVMHKAVALKWLKPRYGEEEQARRRFLQEARAAARIRHPNVIDVYDIGEERDAMYMVMELLEGESLRDHLERRGVPLAETLRHILEAMRGVAAAHAVNITHRDIKPDNVFIAYDAVHRDGIAKVLDFGIAKLHGETMAGLTQVGVAMGTPHYMSIEQLSGAKLDQRSDVYSFGVLLYRALTGLMPYDGDSVGAIVAQALAGVTTRPIELVPELPLELDRIVMRAMARLRDDRFASLNELIGALERVKLSRSSTRSSVQVSAPLVTPPSTRTRPGLFRSRGDKPRLASSREDPLAALFGSRSGAHPEEPLAALFRSRADVARTRDVEPDAQRWRVTWRVPAVLAGLGVLVVTATTVQYWDELGARASSEHAAEPAPLPNMPAASDREPVAASEPTPSAVAEAPATMASLAKEPAAKPALGVTPNAAAEVKPALGVMPAAGARPSAAPTSSQTIILPGAPAGVRAPSAISQASAPHTTSAGGASAGPAVGGAGIAAAPAAAPAPSTPAKATGGGIAAVAAAPSSPAGGVFAATAPAPSAPSAAEDGAGSAGASGAAGATGTRDLWAEDTASAAAADVTPGGGIVTSRAVPVAVPPIVVSRQQPTASATASNAGAPASATSLAMKPSALAPGAPAAAATSLAVRPSATLPAATTRPSVAPPSGYPTVTLKPVTAATSRDASDLSPGASSDASDDLPAYTPLAGPPALPAAAPPTRIFGKPSPSVPLPPRAPTTPASEPAPDVARHRSGPLRPEDM